MRQLLPETSHSFWLFPALNSANNSVVFINLRFIAYFSHKESKMAGYSEYQADYMVTDSNGSPKTL